MTPEQNNSIEPLPAEPDWHAFPVSEVFKRLETRNEGLSQEAAAERLAQYGPNELQAARHISPWEILFEQFKNVLIIILIIATALSAFLGEGVDAVAIAVIVLFVVGLGFVLEYRAERASEALRQMAAPTATVLRNDEEEEIAANEVVPGDVIILRAGDKIPADARLIEAINLQVEEAALTGESMPVEKHTQAIVNGSLAVVDR